VCKFCDYGSKKCEIFQDGLDSTWYLDVNTYEYDEVGKDYIYIKVPIKYCPYCGSEL